MTYVEVAEIATSFVAFQGTYCGSLAAYKCNIQCDLSFWLCLS